MGKYYRLETRSLIPGRRQQLKWKWANNIGSRLGETV